MHREVFTVLKNIRIAEKTYEMTLKGNTRNLVCPGQFINIAVPGFYLRRPISVAAFNEEALCIVYKVVGEGTKALAQLKQDAKLDCLSGLGNGYDVAATEHPVLVGGGVGVPPLFGLAEYFSKHRIKSTVIMGFNTADEVFYADKFVALGHDVYVTTVDGSQGTKGLATDLLKPAMGNYVYACGPLPMLKALFRKMQTLELPGEFSLEERMGCGFGACMGCSVPTRSGYVRICRDGPVIKTSELLWDEEHDEEHCEHAVQNCEKTR